jgi:hypothetical protein
MDLDQVRSEGERQAAGLHISGWPRRYEAKYRAGFSLGFECGARGQAERDAERIRELEAEVERQRREFDWLHEKAARAGAKLTLIQREAERWAHNDMRGTSVGFVNRLDGQRILTILNGDE